MVDILKTVKRIWFCYFFGYIIPLELFFFVKFWINYVENKKGQDFFRTLYKPEYASFLMHLVRLLNKYPLLLRSSQPLYWFKSNMKYIQKICLDYGSEWREDVRKYYTLTSTEEENEEMEYDEAF